MIWVKVCGITREEDAHLAAALGAAAIGFVFWPPSPRYVDPDRARAIRAQIDGGPRAVGVFVNQTPGDVAAIAAYVGLGAVQLHGEERPADYASVGLPLIKAVPLPAHVRRGQDDEALVLPEVPPKIILLVEGAPPSVRGGAGRCADWAVAARLARRRPTILAGGLTPDNVASAIAAVRPYGLDVSSGVESAPGVKDPERLARFFAAVSAAGSPRCAP